MVKTKKMKRYTDNRGFLVENTHPSLLAETKHFFYTKSAPGIIRGNHYHEHKVEWFCIVKGKCRLVTEDIRSKQREETIIKDTDDILFGTEPFVAHAMENIGDSEMIFLGFVNEVLDQKKPDTYSYKVI